MKLDWKKPSGGRCSLHTDDACVEVARTGTQVHVRNSTRPDGGTLVYTTDQWAELRRTSQYFTDYTGGEVTLELNGTAVAFSEAEWYAFLADELVSA